MRDLLPGFYKRTEEELSRLWHEGVFVFDTNMLLNTYRYTQKTKDRYFEILSLLKKRNQLWIPYQAAYEFHDRRIDVIQGQLDAYTDVANILQTTLQKLESSLEPYKSKHGFIDATELSKEITDTIKKAKTRINQSEAKDKSEFESLKKHDRLLEILEELFQDNIGKPYDKNKLDEIYRQAQLRIELKIPPGWEDASKKTYRMYGDIILWFQLLDFARSKKQPIIFVTDDGKKDWWLSDAKSQERDRPLPALVQEMFVETDVLLHMYQGYKFLQEAERFFKLEKKPEIIEEAKEVTQQNTIDLDMGKNPPLTTVYFQLLHKAIEAWVIRKYQITAISERPLAPAKFIATKETGGDIWVGIELRTSMSLLPIDDVFRTLDKYRGLFPSDKLFPSDELFPSEGLLKSISALDEILLFYVFLGREQAEHLASKIREQISLPEGISIVLGYLASNDHFVDVDTIHSN